MSKSTDEGDGAGNSRDLAGRERDQAGRERDQAGAARDQAGRRRYQAGRKRDEAGNQRDDAAEKRDDDAAQRDSTEQLAEQLHPLSQELARRTAAARRAAASDRSLTSQDREAAASDRLLAERDRESALSDRGYGAAARDEAELDRGASARERVSASVDSVTGAYLRGPGFVELERELARAHRRHPLVLAFLDVDGLKGVNDRHGHAAGDRVLRDVVETLRSNLRSHDLVVRYGGDEFVCAISGVSLQEAKRCLNRINRALARRPVPAAVTIGLVEHTPGEGLEELVARADASLYRQRERRFEES